jgi:TonB-dependent starch-binding outer membrane protein SusC
MRPRQRWSGLTLSALSVVDETPLASGTGGLLAINSRDVARTEVRKDAESTSIYGLRGSNGVTKVTTKR